MQYKGFNISDDQIDKVNNFFNMVYKEKMDLSQKHTSLKIELIEFFKLGKAERKKEKAERRKEKQLKNFDRPNKRLRAVVRINERSGERIYYNSIAEAAADHNIAPSNICAACKGLVHSAAGYCWEYGIDPF